jgi:hypothetical protein
MNLALIAGGLALGVLFGALLQRSRLCMVAGVSNWLLIRDTRQLQAFLAAAAVAMLGAGLLEAGGWVALADAGYRAARFDWLGAAAGGLMFGIGATLAGGCAARTLVRSAEGHLGSLITLASFALAAAVTHYGVLTAPRLWLMERSAVALAAGDSSLAVLIGAPVWLPGLALAMLAAGVVIRPGRGGRHPGMIAAGALAGALVAAAWWVSGDLAQDPFAPHPPSSFTVTGPLARGVMIAVGGTTAAWDFGLALVAGLALGALASALAGRQFRWVAPPGERIAGHLVGGLCMGVGGTVAGGCNIGQGLTGLSTASVTSITAAAAMVLGVAAGLAILRRREARAG